MSPPCGKSKRDDSDHRALSGGMVITSSVLLIIVAIAAFVVTGLSLVSAGWGYSAAVTHAFMGGIYLLVGCFSLICGLKLNPNGYQGKIIAAFLWFTMISFLLAVGIVVFIFVYMRPLNPPGDSVHSDRPPAYSTAFNDFEYDFKKADCSLPSLAVDSESISCKDVGFTRVLKGWIGASKLSRSNWSEDSTKCLAAAGSNTAINVAWCAAFFETCDAWLLRAKMLFVESLVGAILLLFNIIALLFVRGKNISMKKRVDMFGISTISDSVGT